MCVKRISYLVIITIIVNYLGTLWFLFSLGLFFFFLHFSSLLSIASYNEALSSFLWNLWDAPGELLRAFVGQPRLLLSCFFGIAQATASYLGANSA